MVVDALVPVAIDARDFLAAEYERGLACAGKGARVHDGL